MMAVIQKSAAGLSYLACGDSARMPVVLLHGIGSDAQSFTALMQSLDRPALAWDAPGYGGSEPLAVEWPDASDYADALGRLLGQLEAPRCVLVGHSLGALIAARFAVLSPGRVAALALISPALGYGTAKGAPLPTPVAERIEELERLGAQGFAAARAPRLLADPTARPDVLQEVERAMAAVRHPGYDQAARLLAGGRLLEDAAKIEVPAAILVGSQDRITPPASARRVFERLPDSSQRHLYREIAAGGHAVCQEQPAAVAHAIAEIVESGANAHA